MLLSTLISLMICQNGIMTGISGKCVGLIDNAYVEE